MGTETAWMLISVTTKGAPPALRVQVWRKLRSLGAHYLQPSVCLLPDRPAVRAEVVRLLARVQLEGGTSDRLTISLSDQAQESQIVASFRAAADVEYGELLGRLPSFKRELADERDKGNLTYAEVEESEADLERFRRWIAKIEARDYFNADLRTAAQAALRECEEQLEAFTLAALAAQTDMSEAAVTAERLSIVEDAG